MDPITEALQAVMQFFGGGSPAAGPPSPGGGGFGQPGGMGSIPSLQQILPLLLTGLQTAGAIQYGGSQLDAMSQLYNMQKQAERMALAMQPGQLGVQAARMAQPLNKQLAYQLTSAADATSALRGLTQAPGATAAGEAQALAPAEQQNQQIGAQLAMQGAGMPIDALRSLSGLQAPNFTGALGGIGQLGYNSAMPFFPGYR